MNGSPAAGVAPSSTLGRIAAVVLNFRTPDETRRAVASLQASEPPPAQIILVDNSAADSAGAFDGLADVRYVPTAANLGFAGGMNAGIRLALSEGADAVLLVNSDATVAPDTVGALATCLRQQPAVGIAGPVLRAAPPANRVMSRGISYDFRTGRMRHRVHPPRNVPPASWQDVDAVSGCVMLIRRAVFDVVGLLDEAYFFSFEDIDFCLHARQAGFASLIVEGATAWHDGGRSIGASSPRRLYFAARNHLRLAARVAPGEGWLKSTARTLAIVGLNAVHAVRSPGGSLFERVNAVAAGTRDHLAGCYGDGPAGPTPSG